MRCALCKAFVHSGLHVICADFAAIRAQLVNERDLAAIPARRRRQQHGTMEQQQRAASERD